MLFANENYTQYRIDVRLFWALKTHSADGLQVRN